MKPVNMYEAMTLMLKDLLAEAEKTGNTEHASRLRAVLKRREK